MGPSMYNVLVFVAVYCGMATGLSTITPSIQAGTSRPIKWSSFPEESRPTFDEEYRSILPDRATEMPSSMIPYLGRSPIPGRPPPVTVDSPLPWSASPPPVKANLQPKHGCPMIESTPEELHALLTQNCEHECLNDQECVVSGHSNTKCCLHGCSFVCQEAVKYSGCSYGNYLNLEEYDECIDDHSDDTGQNVEQLESTEQEEGRQSEGMEQQLAPVEGDVRLYGGPGMYKGRLEIYLNDIWGTVCDKKFTIRMADMVCQQLKLGLHASRFSSHSEFATSTGMPMNIRNIECLSTDTRIDMCKFQRGFTERCTARTEVGIVCEEIAGNSADVEEENPATEYVSDEDDDDGLAVDPTIPADEELVNGDVRLVNGGSANNRGRLEIYVDDSWVTVCDKNFNNHSASRVCRQIGYTGGGVVMARGSFAQGSGPYIMRNIKCNESYIGNMECEQRKTRLTKRCDHTADVGVRCIREITNGQTSQDQNSDEDDDNDVTAVDPTIPADEELVNGDVRLVNGGSANNRGRLEIYVDDSWVTVCDKNFNNHSASLVCRQLGYTGGGVVMPRGSFAQGSGPFIMRNIKCNESFIGNIIECKHRKTRPTKRCDHTADVGIRCIREISNEQTSQNQNSDEDDDDGTAVDPVIPADEELVNGDVRLVNGGSANNRGRLEIYVDDSWVTVCDKNFNNHSASLVCRQLGYTGGGVVMARGSFAQGSGPFIMRNIKCNESFIGNIIECKHRKTRPTKRCDHTGDVGVRCIREIANEQTSQNQNSDEDDDDGTAVDPTIPADEELVNGDVRLVNGGSANNRGRLEIYLDDSWVTVCDKNFNNHSASLVCRQLGYASGGVVMARGSFAQGSGPFIIRNIKCNESYIGNIIECGHRKTRPTKRCDHTADVGVRCIREITNEQTSQNQNSDEDDDDGTAVDPTIPADEELVNGDVRLVNGSADNRGRLEIYIDTKWVTVCDKKFDDRLASLVCRQLGYTHGGLVLPRGSFGQSFSFHIVRNIKCDENFNGNIIECQYQTGFTNRCDHTANVDIECQEI